MDLLEIIIHRRSIRKYTGQPVDDALIEKLIQAGMYAPSAVNKQPWHFVIFRDRDTRKKITEIHKNAWMLKDASVGILVCWDETLQHDTGYGPVDCAAATQNILLAAHASGLGGVWIGVYPREDRINNVHKIFQLPKAVQPFSLIALGYPDEMKTLPERFNPSRIHFEKW